MWPRCAAATVVTTATCGRASAASGAISPGWFMPISQTQNRASSGSRARVSGTPQWLLCEAAAAWVGPIADSAARSISLVVVLPTLPVTATTRPRNRARPARPSACSAAKVSATCSRRGSPRSAAGSRSGSCTSAAAAPRASAPATWSWPSPVPLTSATNSSPGATVRLSIEMPETASGGAPS